MTLFAPSLCCVLIPWKRGKNSERNQGRDTKEKIIHKARDKKNRKKRLEKNNEVV